MHGKEILSIVNAKHVTVSLVSTQMDKSQFHHPATLADGLRLSAAFKNALTERRVAVRIAVQVHAQELGEGRNDQANLADGYKTRVEMLCWIFLRVFVVATVLKW